MSLGFCRARVLAALSLVLLGLCPIVAKADNPPVLYHSLSDTFGCGDPAAAIAMTDPNEPRRKSASWIKSTFTEGHCVSITPKSPWRFVSKAGDVALMDYAGTVGPPGSYYIRIDQMVDPNGAHPGDSQPPQAGNQPAPAPAPASDTASPTALAPAAGPVPSSSPAPSVQGVEPVPVTAPAPSGERASWTTTDVALLLVGLALAFAAGFVLARRR